MAEWKYVLDVKDAWQKTKKNELTIKEFISILITKVQELNIQNDSLLEYLMEDFKGLLEEDSIDIEEFDGLWEELYDWADQVIEPGYWPRHKLCWLKTF
jgi:hypothetical protein